MASDDRPTPLDSNIPGGWPQTPAAARQPSYSSYLSRPTGVSRVESHAQTPRGSGSASRQSSLRGEGFTAAAGGAALYGAGYAAGSNSGSSATRSSDDTAVASRYPSEIPPAAAVYHPTEEVEDSLPVSADASPEHDDGFAPMKSEAEKPARPALQTTASKRRMTEADLMKHLSRRNTGRTGQALTRAATQQDHDDEMEEVNRLMSTMFGHTRQEHSEEEKTRHVGVVFKNLTVKGMGLGAALQPTFGDVFLGLPRFLSNLFTKGPRKAKGKPPVKTIIDDFSGVIKPGEMCLILGRPGSGCSTILKVLGNQRFGYESIDGDVTYGGTDWHTMLKKYRGEIVYNPEDDLHYATLSVKNTLTFALKTKTPGKESRNEGETASQYVSNFLTSVVKLFWIEHTLGTKVGNEYVRGVSGGEKKRVSIAEAMITKASIQMWDNSTRGLDSSTALEYVESLRALTNMAHISTGVALYQAGENLYDCFDKVMLLDEGRCCYFGHTEDAAKYFTDLGFDRPDRWTTADFLTSVTDKHERKIQPGWEDRVPRSASQFGDIFAKSEQHQANLREIDKFERGVQVQVEERHKAQGKATRRKNYTIPFWRQVIACTHRQFLVMIGDKQSLGGKWGGILFQALIVGSLFFQLPSTAAGVFARGGLLFNALLALAELTSAFESRPILLKHKAFQFYRPAAYAIAQTVVDIPLVFVQVFIFDIVVYWMAGLSATASQFFISLLFLFILTMTMYALFRAVGALVSSLDVATRITGVMIQALVVYTGYLIPPSKMHPWFSWIRWINPIYYGFEGLMSNEFNGLNIECVPPYLVPQGPGATAQYQGCTIQGSQPGSTVVSGSQYIETAFDYSRAHLWRNFGIICAFFLASVALTALGMELQKPNKGGGAVTIYKRGQVPKAVETALATGEESNDLEKSKSATSDPSGLAYAEKSKDESSGSEDESTVKGIAKNEAVFTFSDVNYTIPFEGGERKLLQNVQGFVRPGKLTALMGASGAGKTTLLNTLAQRINFGVITGDFLVDGRPLPRSFQRSTGFAEQQDVHEPTATVREALRFSAKLRQPREVPLQDKYEYVETVLKLLEMESIAGAIIGKIGAGLNQEQRKRLTIAVELASKPELLFFLDEPTSGLDSGAAFNVVRFLRKLADAGQAILCTIHQPSAVLFEEFDELILLKSGGRLVYEGELGHDSRKLLDYFESNGGKKCPHDANPAEYMLEVIGAGDPDYKGQDWGDVWERSQQNQGLHEEVQHLVQERRNAATGGETKDQREFAMPMGTQVYTVVHRNFVAYWRTKDYLIGKFMLHIFTGIFNAFTFWNLGNSQIDMQSRLFSIFMVLTISPPLIQQLQPKYLELRNIYQSRERNSKIYSWFAFTCAAILPELPWSFVAGTLYWAAWFWPPHFSYGGFTSAYVWLFVTLFEVFYVSFGQAIAAFSPNELLASLFVPLLFLFVVSFCGVVVPYAGLPAFWKAWMYWLTPFKYLLEGLLSLITHGQPLQCDESELARFPAPPGQTCQSYAGPYVVQAGGYVTTLGDGLCGFCQFANGDEFAASFNVYYRYVNRDYAIFWGFCAFNFAAVFFFSWLYLQGGHSIKSSLSPKARKDKKAMAKRAKEAGGDKA
ncbi:ATP-binding cassette transporter snq2 [Teratosphaeriaceae sp. CCFEE 6253]|nr:ATP-binding cassette transporter snq2 [Teratosphaeriaceae sp. CCFEE 6253]